MARFRKNDFFKWAQKIKSVFCFNPHTHEGCDFLFLKFLFQLHVSIHTPTKGVTSPHNWFRNNFAVSIHTPTKGVTFTPTSILWVFGVSIHTPTKGVTPHVH